MEKKMFGSEGYYLPLYSARRIVLFDFFHTAGRQARSDESVQTDISLKYRRPVTLLFPAVL